MRVWWILLAGCGGTDDPVRAGPDLPGDTDTDGAWERPTDTPPDDSAPPATDSADTAPTGTSEPIETADTGGLPTVVSASCAQQTNNVLRYDCTVEVDPPGAARVRLVPAAGEAVTFPSDALQATHDITLWGMRATADHTWEAWAEATPTEVETGAFTTAILPQGFRLDVARTVNGPYATKWVMFNTGCMRNEALIVLDDEGFVVWYHDVEDIPTIGWPVFVYRGYAFTEDRTVLALIEHRYIVELDLAGNVLLLLGVELGDFDDPVHHDVQRHDGHTYALFAEQVPYPDGKTYVMDGVYVFDAAGDRVKTWSTQQILDPQGSVGGGGNYWFSEFPGAIDFGHANAIHPGAAGVTMSLRNQHALLHLEGGPANPDFGSLEWTLVGDGPSDLVSDLSLTSVGGVSDDLRFSFQHHVAWTDAGTLTVFDNNVPPAEARGLELTIDPIGGTADIVGAWPAGLPCIGQGSHFVLPNGNALLDCAPERRLLEVTPTGETVLELEPRCAFGAPSWVFYRGVPVDLSP